MSKSEPLIQSPCDPRLLAENYWKPPQHENSWFARWFSSPYYPILYKKRDEREAEEFIAKVLEHMQLHPGSTVLDLACGRGRHARFLRQFGHSVIGYDLSKESILEANRFSDEHLHFYVHDMRQAFPHRNFDAVFNLFTSFGYFQNVMGNCLTLTNIAHATRPGGWLIIDYFNADKVLQDLIPEEEKYIHEIRFKIRKYVEKGGIFKEITVFDGAHTEQHTEEVQLLSKAYFEAMLIQTGFEIHDKWGDYEGNDFAQDRSPRLILFAKKKSV
jgi:SAM-dependent methyltransferase